MQERRARWRSIDEQAAQSAHPIRLEAPGGDVKELIAEL